MNKQLLSLLFLLIFTNSVALAQEKQIITPDNLQKYLSSNIDYPLIGNTPAGNCDLALELTIEKNGELTNIENLSSCTSEFFNNTVTALSTLENVVWTPEVIGDSTIQSKKLLIVKFRRYSDQKPVQYLSETKKLLKKEKYKKAIKLINKGIAEHPYNSKYYLYRSLVYQQLGEDEKSTADRKKAEELENVVFTIAPVTMLGISRSQTRTIIR